MKHFIHTILILVAAFSLIPSPAHAEGGHTIGNGGNGILQHGRVYLHDLVEAGESIARDPYYVPTRLFTPSDNQVRNAIERRMRQKFQAGSPPRLRIPYRLLSRKLAMIHKRSPIMASILISSIEYFDWNWHNNAVVTADVADRNIILNRDQERVTLGWRRDRAIHIATENLRRSSFKHRVAFILHEALIPFVRLRDCRVGHGQTSICSDNGLRLDSNSARAWIGFIHKPEFRTASGENLHSRIQLAFLDSVPTRTITERPLTFSETEISLHLTRRDRNRIVLGYEATQSTQSQNSRVAAEMSMILRRNFRSGDTEDPSIFCGVGVPRIHNQQYRRAFLRPVYVRLSTQTTGVEEGRGLIRLYGQRISVSFDSPETCRDSIVHETQQITRFIEGQ